MEPHIHVSRNQVTIGVFSEAQIYAGLGQGNLTPNDYCWTEGMTQWKTIREAYPHLIPSNPAATPSSPNQPSANYPSGGERFGAYMLDGLFIGLMSCGVAIPLILVLVAAAETDSRNVANAITDCGAAPGHDENGGTVGCLTEAMMGVTSGLIRIAEAISDLARAIREREE